MSVKCEVSKVDKSPCGGVQQLRWAWTLIQQMPRKLQRSRGWCSEVREGPQKFQNSVFLRTNNVSVCDIWGQKLMFLETYLQATCVQSKEHMPVDVLLFLLTFVICNMPHGIRAPILQLGNKNCYLMNAMTGLCVSISGNVIALHHDVRTDCSVV